MDDSTLTNLLAQLRAAPLPAVPGSFRQDVWRTIRLRSSRATESWWAWFFEPLLRPAMAAASLALAIVVGASLGVATLDSRTADTRHALGLEVFSTSAPALPTTLMAHAR